MPEAVIIDVAAAVLVHERKVLLARRYGGYLDNLWEFPGGKLEREETAAHAARRELSEELAIKVEPDRVVLVLEHAYPDKKVRLHFVSCRLSAASQSCLAQLQQNPSVGWFLPNELPLAEFCPADRLAAKQLPWQEIFNSEESK